MQADRPTNEPHLSLCTPAGSSEDNRNHIADMADILVLVASSDGKLKRSSLEALSRCKSIASEQDLTVCAFLPGSDAERHVEAVSACGPDEVILMPDSRLDTHQNHLLLNALAAAVEETGPRLVAMSSTEAVKDVLGSLAVRIDASALSDVGRFDLVPEGAEAVRPVMASKYKATVRAKGPRVVVSIRAGAYDVVEQPGSPTVREIRLPEIPTDGMAILREVVSSGSGTVDLSEAEVIVAAGRGVRDEQGKALVEELAGLFGGAVGSSRAVVETGLFPTDSQIGQTGKVVSPTLYFAVGISGAIQHVAGMLNSKTIVAVNKDPEAPIFKYATYGIPGDLYTVLPLLIAEIKKHRSST